MQSTDAIYVAGHSGLVGSAIVRQLQAHGYHNIISRRHSELDLLDQAAVRHFFEQQPIDYVFLAAAKVGGIMFNRNYQADFLYENLMMAANVIKAAADSGVKKLLFLGSSCIYPKMAPQPIKEEYLLSGPLEPTNEGYALAKIAGLKLCEKYQEQYGKCFISVMPTNLYGPGDNYHPDHSHVIPGMLRRFHEAKERGAPEVLIWGSGTVRREFLHVADCAEALRLVMLEYNDRETINIGAGEDISIRDLAELVKETVGFTGAIRTDPSKPDGTPRKLLDSSRLRALGWQPQFDLRQGLRDAYHWALENRVF